MNDLAFEKAQQKKRSAKRGKIILLITVLTVILGIVLYLLSDRVFIINKVNINDLTIYDTEEVLDALDIPEGRSILFTSFKDRYEKLKRKYPYIISVNIQRSLPDTLNIMVTEDCGCMKIDIGSETYLLTKDLTVVSILSESKESERLLGNDVPRIRLETGRIARCVVGEKIEFGESYIFDAVKGIYAALEKCGVEKNIEYIDLTEKFYIEMYYDERFLIQFGNWEDALSKTRLFVKVAEELYEDDHGKIDVSSTREAIVSLRG